jgi:transcriptional regulator of heat shock response
MKFVIKEYSKRGEPIGSFELRNKIFSNLSPATLRRELSILEKNDFLYQPHISAGRIPTDKGYRWFVDEVIKDEEGFVRNSDKWLERIKEKNCETEEEKIHLIADFCDGLGVILNRKGLLKKFGLKNIFSSMRELDNLEIEKIFEDIENLDKKIEYFFDEFDNFERAVFIGKESPITNSNNLSVVFRVLSDKKKEAILLIGSKNMLYDRNLAVLEAIANLVD